MPVYRCQSSELASVVQEAESENEVVVQVKDDPERTDGFWVITRHKVVPTRDVNIETR